MICGADAVHSSPESFARMTSAPPIQELQIGRPQFELRVAAVFAILFLSPGVHIPYLPVWLAGHGFDPNAIAVILAAPMFLRLVTTPIILAAADRSGDRAVVFTLMAGASFALSLGYFLPPTYAVVLVVSLLLAVPWTPIAPLADSVALTGVRRLGCSYTKMRIWGSISYLVGNFVGGIVLGWYGFNSVPIMMSVGLALLFLVSLWMPRVGPPRRATPMPGEIVESSWRFSHRFLLCAIGAGLIAGSHFFINGFMSIYWQSIGYSDATIGFLWSWSVGAEVVIFLLFLRLFGSWSAVSILALAAVASIVRWIIYPLVEPFGLGLAGYFLVQSLHPFSTGLMLIGLQKVIGEEISEARTGAAQGLAFLFNGLSGAAITLISGPIYDRFDVYGTLPMALVAAVALGLILAASRYPQRAASAGKTSEPS
jgi:PPP family 3-phenylpropionic acid transporter